jgi:acetyl esterase/lipase
MIGLMQNSAEALGRAKKMPYKTVGDVNLNLQVYSPTGHKKTDKKPAVVFFYGGGWRSGSTNAVHSDCEDLAKRGIVAIAPEYRIKKKHKTTPRECLQDAKSAIRWVRSNAETLGIDPDRIVAGGQSAGGHLAIAALTAKGFDEPGEDTSVSTKLSGLILYNPVIDNGPEKGAFGHKFVKAFWEGFSPRHNLHKDLPPTIIFQGTKDKFIPIETMTGFRDEMKALGISCDLHIYEGGVHGFWFKDKGLRKDTLAKTAEFLKQLGCIK